MRAISLTQADIYKGELILVNAEHPYFENLAKPNLVPAASGNADILLEQNTATHLSQRYGTIICSLYCLQEVMNHAGRS